ncbi:MAG: hypothetical protein EXS17_00330 [Phycisphaerales bacterium]|nr:hypothetical protein [Phycisphaerales bacterium]
MNHCKLSWSLALACTAAISASALAQSKTSPTAPTTTKPATAQKAPAKAKATAKPAATVAPSVAPATPADPAEQVKSVYVVPMGFRGRGQFGLDIHPSVYEQVAADVAEKKPDLVVYVLNSADIDTVAYMGDDPREQGVFDDDSIRKMTRDLKAAINASGAEQVMVVRDAVGYSALLGLSWPNMYMTESARLMGLSRIQERTQVEDPEVFAKFREAFVGICNGFLVSGGYNPSIGLAMMRPEKMLSASFKGREITWREDDKGTWIVDNSEKHFAGFSAQSAEELGLSDGTVADELPAMLEDLMYQRGFREFQRMPEDGEQLVQEYVDGWRKAYESCKKSFESFQEALGNASGKDELKYLNQAKSTIDKVLALMKKYPAVAIRLNREFGVGKVQLETEALKIQERIKGLRKAPPSGGSGSKGSSPAGPGLGSGG